MSEELDAVISSLENAEERIYELERQVAQLESDLAEATKKRDDLGNIVDEVRRAVR